MHIKNLLIVVLLLNACMLNPEKDAKNNRKANRLINESSPYLLQHAYNPVEWYPWGEEALAKAKNENKPLLISIGYSACHWCHVMEHESFEDSTVAAIMNEQFVNIKVDREERPDVDHIYMDAVQLMNNRGGWPLNCFATAEGKPFYGGTYFPKEQWIDVLKQIKEVYANDREKVNDYANKLTEGIRQSNLVQTNFNDTTFENIDFSKGIDDWKNQFDQRYGGNKRAPKFPMPNNYEFLLHYNQFAEDSEIENHLKTTLKNLAYGGIYDQLGGGFSRYSTDLEWKVPHFEKMLYDNAQLISLFAKAYQKFKEPIYHSVIKESINFIERELYDSESGAFYSALDADSEGEEGKFYIWNKEELKDVLGSDYDLIKKHYNLNNKGFWENGHYILLRDEDDAVLSQDAGLSISEYQEKVSAAKKVLLGKRAERIRPGLDDKSLTSWNALMITALTDAYLATGEKSYLKLALKNAAFISQQQTKEDNSLYHSYKNGKSSINGFLEDYSFTIEAYLKLYQATFNEDWIKEADQLAAYVFTHFHDKNSQLFFFTSDEDTKLINRKIELSDNVIPASNSSMAKALFLLGTLTYNKEYVSKAKNMLMSREEDFNNYLPYNSNWAQLYLWFKHPFYEIAICGEEAISKNLELNQFYFPNTLILGATAQNTKLDLLEGKFNVDRTMIYVCENKSCQLPVEQVSDAISQIKP